MRKLILFLDIQKEYDQVLFDSSSLLGVADTSILSPNVDGVVLAVNEVDRQAPQKAKESLAKVKAHILGVVLSKVKPGLRKILLLLRTARIENQVNSKKGKILLELLVPQINKVVMEKRKISEVFAFDHHLSK